MRPLAALVVLTGLVLSLGCGRDNKAIPPGGEVPPPPKGPPTAQGAGGGAKDKGKVRTMTAKPPAQP
jgi:hypothetical protein